jgi:hypothetical protein
MTASLKALPDMHTPSDRWLTFSEWESHQRCYARFDRDDTEHDSWIVVPYTFCPNVASILDESNHEALIAALDATGSEDYVVRHHNHWATPYDMILVRPGSAAFDAADSCIAALANYPVLNEEDFSRREYEATCQNIASELRRTTVERGGVEVDSEELAGELFSWFWENDQSAVEATGDGGGYPTPEQIEDGLRGLGFVDPEDGGAWLPASEHEPGLGDVEDTTE